MAIPIEKEEPKGRAKTLAGNVMNIKYDAIRPDPNQPRKTFHTEALNEMAESLDSEGLLQPIIIRPDEEAATKERRYIIIAGERRWRAAGMLGWDTIPSIVRRDLTSKDVSKLQLLENIVRQDLDPVEEARAMAGMVDEGCTVQDLGNALGRPIQQINWRIQMLNAAPEVLKLVSSGDLVPSTAHTISTLPPERQLDALHLIVKGNLNHSQALLVCEKIQSGERQDSLMTVPEMPPEQQRAASSFSDTFRLVCSRLAKCEELEQQAPGSLAAALTHKNDVVESQIDEAIRGLQRIKRLLQVRRVEGMVEEES